MSHPAPRRHADAETDKRSALKLVALAARREDVAEASKANAVRFAADNGATAGEIASAAALPETTVRAILRGLGSVR